jgi:hypothetical protein
VSEIDSQYDIRHRRGRHAWRHQPLWSSGYGLAKESAGLSPPQNKKSSFLLRRLLLLLLLLLLRSPDALDLQTASSNRASKERPVILYPFNEHDTARDFSVCSCVSMLTSTFNLYSTVLYLYSISLLDLSLLCRSAYSPVLLDLYLSSSPHPHLSHHLFFSEAEARPPLSLHRAGKALLATEAEGHDHTKTYFRCNDKPLAMPRREYWVLIAAMFSAGSY